MNAIRDVPAPVPTGRTKSEETQAGPYQHREERQIISLRWVFIVIIIIIALCILIYLGVLAKTIFSIGNFQHYPPIVLVSLIVTPILSLTALIIMGLSGVFKSRDNLTDKEKQSIVNLSRLIAESQGSG